MNAPNRRTLHLLVAMGLTMSACSFNHAEAIPELDKSKFDAGKVEVKQEGKTEIINQTTNRVALDWHSFNIAADEGVEFIQPKGGIALNRILDSNPSTIFGSLKANGTVLLLNPHGILFGEGKTIEVGNLVASTAWVEDDFMKDFAGSKNDIKLQLGDDSAGAITVGSNTTIKAQGGLVALHASIVENKGNIEAEDGKIALAAVKELKLSVDSAGKINFTTSGEIANANAINRGHLTADGGYIVMTAKQAGDALANVVNNEGVIEANTIKVNDKGEILLDGGSHGVVNISGTVSASGTTEKQIGGTIKIAGKEKEIVNNANLRADGAVNGNGGQIQISGGKKLSVSNEAVISATGKNGGTIQITEEEVNIKDKANLLANGNASGGKIQISKGKKLSVAGEAEVNASGGESGGTIQITENEARINDKVKLLANGDAAGGSIQFSGGEKLSISDQSEISAAGGKQVGELLVDSPVDIHIGDKDPDEAEKLDEQKTDQYLYENRHLRQEDLNSLSEKKVINNYIKADYVSYLLSNGTSVTINSVDRNRQSDKRTALGQADIYVDKPIEKSAVMSNKAGGRYGDVNSDATLTLQAQRNIYVNNPITAKDGKLNVNLHADTNGVGKGMVVIDANVDTNGGNFTAGTGVNITDGTVGTFIGNVTSRKAKEIKITTKGGDADFYGDVGLGIEDGNFIVDTTGNTGKGNINISGNLGSVNTYEFFINSTRGGADVKDDPKMKQLARVYYDKYLKNIVWINPDDLETATVTTADGKTMRLYDWLKERCLGANSQFQYSLYDCGKGKKITRPEENSAEEKEVIKEYYQKNVYLGSYDTPSKAFDDLTDAEYTTLARHILTAYDCGSTTNRESILTRWDLARTAVQENRVPGKTADDTYLATITTPLEDWVVNSQLVPLVSKGTNEELFLGGRTEYTGDSTQQENRRFSWQTGPEAGQVFYVSSGKGTGTTSLNMYQGWSHDVGYNEPNNDSKYEQPFVAIGSRIDTTWADVNDQKNNVRGFVQEENMLHANVTLKSSTGDITIGGNVGKSAPLQSLNIETAGKVTTGGGANPGTMDKNKEHQYQINTGGKYTGMMLVDGQVAIVGEAGVDIGDHITADSVNINSKRDIVTRGIETKNKVALSTEGPSSAIIMEKQIKTDSQEPDAVIIDAHEGRLVNKSDAGMGIETGKGGSWKIYTGSPVGNEYGKNLNSGTYALWGRDDGELYSYTAVQADDYKPDAVNGRYIFSCYPVLTYSAEDMEKTYGDSVKVENPWQITAMVQGADILSYKDKAFDESAVWQDAQDKVDVVSDGFAKEATRTGGQNKAADGNLAVYDITMAATPEFANSAAAAHGYKPEFAGEKGKLTINRKKLDVQVNLAGEYGSDVYKETLAAPNLVNGDAIVKSAYRLDDRYASKVKASAGTVTADAGTYDGVVVADAVDFKDSQMAANYDITFVKGSLTLVPHDIVLQPTGEGKELAAEDIYNAGMPYEKQLVNGDTLADAPTLSWLIGSKQSDNAYGIDLLANKEKIGSGDVMGNYRFHYQGTYTLRQADVPAVPDRGSGYRPIPEPASTPVPPSEPTPKPAPDVPQDKTEPVVPPEKEKQGDGPSRDAQKADLPDRERPLLPYVSTDPHQGQGSYQLENEPEEGPGQKVLGLTVAKLPFGKKVQGNIYDYGTYQVTVEPGRVSLLPADKEIPVPRQTLPNQYREYTRMLTAKGSTAAFKLVYDGAIFAIHPADASAVHLLEAGDAARNVDVASQALHAAFKEMGLELEDIDAVYICFD